MIKKTLAALLITTLLLIISSKAGLGEGYESKKTSVYTSVTNSLTYTEILFTDNQVYMPLDDILRFTQFECDYSLDDSRLTLKRSNKLVGIDFNQNLINYHYRSLLRPQSMLPATLLAGDYIDEPITWQNKMWLPVYPTMSYLNTVLETCPDNEHLIIINAEYTLMEFAAKFSRLVESELCTIWGYEDIWYSDSLIYVAAGLDIIGSGSYYSIFSGSYTDDFYKDILLSTLGEGNYRLASELPDHPAFIAVQTINSLYMETEWYDALKPREKLLFEAFDYSADNFVDLYTYYVAINDLSETNINILRDAILTRSLYDNELRRSRLFRHASDIVKVYDGKAIGVMGYDAFVSALEYGLEKITSKYTDKFALGVNLVSEMYDALGVAPVDIYNIFVASKHYYEIQQNAYNIHRDILMEIASDSSKFNHERIDGLYASTLLYIKLYEAYASNLLDASPINVYEATEAFLNINKSELYLDNPKLIEIYATVEDFLLLKEIPDDMIWADDGKCTFVNVEVLRLRSGPGTDYEILDRLFYGTPLEVKDRENEWLFVDVYPGCVYRNNQGWVHGDYVESGYGPYPSHPSDYGVTIRGKAINYFMEVSEVVNLIGEPTEIVLNDYQDFSNYYYHYPGVILGFSNFLFMMSQFSSESSEYINEYELLEITVDGNQVSGPRNIRVGDSFESVLDKFPDSNNAIKVYSQDTRGEYRRILYGRDEIPPVGYIYYDKNQKPLFVWFNNYPESYLSIEFEDEKVVNVFLYLQLM